MSFKNTLQEVDRIEVIALMDNLSDPFTKSHKDMRFNETQYQFEINNKSYISGAHQCRACNGLSLLIKIHCNKNVYQILFDTGPDKGLVIENAERLEIDLSQIDAIFLSHGHYDHYGGILSVLDAIKKPNIPVYTHPEVFTPRAFKKNKLIPVSDQISPKDIANHGGKLITSNSAETIFDNTLLMSGEVPRKTSYEKGSPSAYHFVDNCWQEAPEIMDERIMIMNLKNHGLCVFTGCGHTGVVNALMHAKELTSQNSVHMVMGGFHLAGPEFSNRIKDTVVDLEEIQPNFIITGHCTGQQAQFALQNQFGERHMPYAVGTYFNFHSDKL